jgi:hypothetical protein
MSSLAWDGQQLRLETFARELIDAPFGATSAVRAKRTVRVKVAGPIDLDDV